MYFHLEQCLAFSMHSINIRCCYITTVRVAPPPLAPTPPQSLSPTPSPPSPPPLQPLLTSPLCVFSGISGIQLFATCQTVARQAPLSMGFSGQEYWSRLPFPLPRDLPNPGIQPASPALAAGFFTSEPPGKHVC